MYNIGLETFLEAYIFHIFISCKSQLENFALNTNEVLLCLSSVTAFLLNKHDIYSKHLKNWSDHYVEYGLNFWWRWTNLYTKDLSYRKLIISKFCWN